MFLGYGGGVSGKKGGGIVGIRLSEPALLSAVEQDNKNRRTGLKD